MASLQTEIDTGALRSAIWKTRSAGVEKIARVVICVRSLSTWSRRWAHSNRATAGGTNFLQQAVALLMWAVLIYASAFVRPRLQWHSTPI